MTMKLWIVGMITSEDGKAWEFVGVFSSEEKAVAACTKYNFFVGPAELDERFPDDSNLWPGAYYPISEVKP